MLEDLKGGQSDWRGRRLEGEEGGWREKGKKQVWRVRPKLNHLIQVKSLDLIWSITLNYGKV